MLNPFCPPEQKRKILSYDPANPINVENGTDNDYNWNVYGLGLKAEKPNRIFHFKEISDKKWFELETPVYYGVDWGAVDPMGIVAAKYYDGGLYLKELSYLSENKLKDNLTNGQRNQIADSEEGFITWYFNKLQLDKERPVICDNNRQSKIIALRRLGFDYALSARKPKGSIIDGIDTLNSLDVFYTSSSLNLKMEQEVYSRKKDRHGVVLEEPEDRDNHIIDPVRYIVLYLQDEGIINIL
jgi:phage terminase large subunit